MILELKCPNFRTLWLLRMPLRQAGPLVLCTDTALSTGS